MKQADAFLDSVQPQFDRVLVRLIDAPWKNKIAIPEASKAKNHAEILAIGPGCWEHGVFVATHLKVGQKVLLGSQRAAFVLDMQHDDCFIIHESEILATFE